MRIYHNLELQQLILLIRVNYFITFQKNILCKMGGITLMLVLLCIATSVNGAAVSNIDTILPPSQAQINAIESGIESENTISPIDTIDKLNVCTSEVCAKESTIMRNSMDQTVNPCENFYDFACGNYVRNTVLPEDKAVDLSFFQVQDKVSEQLRLILMEDPQPDELQPFKLAKEFTKICMDEENLNKEGNNSKRFILNLNFPANRFI